MCVYLLNSSIECPVLRPLKSMTRVSLARKGQDQLLSLFCIALSWDLIRFTIGPLQETWEWDSLKTVNLISLLMSYIYTV